MVGSERQRNPRFMPRSTGSRVAYAASTALALVSATMLAVAASTSVTAQAALPGPIPIPTARPHPAIIKPLPKPPPSRTGSVTPTPTPTPTLLNAPRAPGRTGQPSRAAPGTGRSDPPPTHDLGPSSYRGEAYVPSQEPRRLCIIRRESGGDFTIVSSNGLYFGAYQFARGTADTAASWMGKRDLIGVAPNRWSKFEQDQAFWTIWDGGRGASHWGHAC